MIIIIFPLSISILLAYYSLIIDGYVDKFSYITTTCYRSNTYPIQFFELLHNFPTGPHNLYVISKLYIFPTEDDSLLINITQIYQFIRIDDSCPRSLRYNSKAIPISRINLLICIYLLDKITKISDVEYLFQDGFEPGSYLLIGVYTNFAVIADISNFEEHEEHDIHLSIENWPTFSSTSQNYSYICVVTGQNKAIILHPDYENDEPPGFITQIIGKNKIGEILMDYKYPAFECQSEKSFSNKNFVLIEEDFVDTNLKFFALSHRYNHLDLITDEISFTIPDAEIIKVSQIRNIISNKKIIYFLHKSDMKTFFNNQNKLTIHYFSARKKIYDIRHMEEKSVLPSVRRLLVTTTFV